MLVASNPPREVRRDFASLHKKQKPLKRGFDFFWRERGIQIMS
jgi:hypothetical protein